MAVAILTGGRKVIINDDKARKILGWKNDPLIDKTRIVDLGNEWPELGQIKNIVFTDNQAPTNDNTKIEERKKYLEELNIIRNTQRKQSPEEKAKRMTETGCILLWTSRGNDYKKIDDDILTQLMITLIGYFEKNTNEWWAGREVYQHLIPFKQPAVTAGVSGWKSIGELICTQ